MAQRVQVIRVSDISGEDLGEGGQTVEFSYKGKDFTIDLSDKEAEKFDKAMEFYIAHGTKSSGRRSSGRKASGSEYDPKLVREWAAANGIDVPARGRMPATVIDQYKAAH